MAGSDSRFNATKFRDGIRFAMTMGFPEDTAKRITWRWSPARTFAKPDSGGFPLVWSSSQVTSEVDITDLSVLCAVKFTQVGGQTRVGGTALGIMDIASVTATLIDTDYDLLIAHGLGDFPDRAVIDENIYVVQIKPPPYGLFDVTIYDIILQAIDES